MRSTLKQLEYIYNVLTFENISRAAKKCFISQPAMTQCVQEFEEENRLLLFERKGRRLVITEEGKEIKKELAVLLLAIRDFESKLNDIAESNSGKVMIGIPPVILTVYFYDIISSFVSKNPQVQLEIIELGANELKKQLIQGDIEMAILIEPFESKLCSKTLLVESTFSAVVNKAHPLSGEKSVTLTDLAQEQLILLNEEFQLYYLIQNSFEQHGLKPNVVFKSKQWDLLINMIVHNPRSISILPTPIVEMYPTDQLTIIPVDLATNWKIILVQRNSLNATIATQQFLSFVNEWFQ